MFCSYIFAIKYLTHVIYSVLIQRLLCYVCFQVQSDIVHLSQDVHGDP